MLALRVATRGFLLLLALLALPLAVVVEASLPEVLLVVPE